MCVHAAKPVPLSQSFIDDPVLCRGKFWACPFFLFSVSSGGCVCPLALLRERPTHKGLAVIAPEGFWSVAFSAFDLGSSEINGNPLTLTQGIGKHWVCCWPYLALRVLHMTCTRISLRWLSPLSMFCKGENGHGGVKRPVSWERLRLVAGKWGMDGRQPVLP